MRFARYAGQLKDAAYADALGSADAVFDPWSSADGNISNYFMLDGRRATVRLSAHARDLLDFASMIYLADEIVPRAAAADSWTRELCFATPVSQHAAWTSATPTLTECLRFLSGDNYEFEWLARPNTVPARTVHKLRLKGAYDAACLFSGGVDSFLGAAMLLEQGKRLLLVGHYVDGVTSSAQRDLATFLRRRFPGQFTLLQVHVARGRANTLRYKLPKKAEITHRSRSFIFLGAAVAAASAVNAPTVYIPENGLIALNAPLGSSRRGTLSTRTAHPRFLQLFGDWVRTLGFSAKIENPFMYLSKTDMLVQVSDPELRQALLRTVSCAHAGDLWRHGVKGVTHCGYCVPCLYRRVAFLAAGLDEKGYYCDIFTALPNLSPETARDCRLLVRFAREVVGASEARLRTLVLHHGWFPADPDGAAYADRAAMLKRWAESFLSIMQTRANKATRRVLGL